MRFPSMVVLALALAGCPKDSDGDGYSTDDCDDSNAHIHPGAEERCNGVDDDCDGGIDDADGSLNPDSVPTWYLDYDGDGFGDSSGTFTFVACDPPDGYVADDTDCDNADPLVHPVADEVCNEVDDDCDGLVDDDDPKLDLATAATWYADADDDLHGNPDTSTVACAQPSGHVAVATDCDDADPSVFTGAPERCDGVDTDCDPATSEDGLVSFDDGSGPRDITDGFVGLYEMTEAGTLLLCDGTFEARLDVRADVTVRGVRGDPALATLDARFEGPNLWTLGAHDVVIEGISFVNGVEDRPEVGAGVTCNAAGATLSLADVDIGYHASAIPHGPGMALGAVGCDLTVTRTRIYDLAVGQYDRSPNTPVLVARANASFTETTIEQSPYWGVEFYDGVTATFDEVLVTRNLTWAESYASVRLLGSSLEWVGTPGTVSGPVGSGIDVEQGSSFVANSVDFDGTTLELHDSGFAYQPSDDATFTCDDQRCGTPISYALGDLTSSSTIDDYVLGNVIIADTTATIEGFEVYTAAGASCDVTAYVLSHDSPTQLMYEAWTLEWSAPVTWSATSGFQPSGPIGVVVESGDAYALAWGFRCSGVGDLVEFSLGASGSDAGFGTYAGAFYGPWTTAWSHSATFSATNQPYRMNIDVTDL